jgi:RNA recognition motif-containing protein
MDKRTGDSLQYAFIEFEEQKDCEQAYFKMQGVLIAVRNPRGSGDHQLRHPAS